MSLFMERGVNQVERELRVLRPGLPEKAPLVAIVEAHQGDHDHQHGDHGHERQVHVGHRDTKRPAGDRAGAAIRELSLIAPVVSSGS